MFFAYPMLYVLSVEAQLFSKNLQGASHNLLWVRSRIKSAKISIGDSEDPDLVI